MKFNGIVVIFYGFLTLIGGVIGFVKAHSSVSLAMGTLFGIGLIISGVAAYKEKKEGIYASFALALVMCLFFTYRFILTQSLMPAGLMSAISLIILIALYLGGTSKKID